MCSSVHQQNTQIHQSSKKSTFMTRKIFQGSLTVHVESFQNHHTFVPWHLVVFASPEGPTAWSQGASGRRRGSMMETPLKIGQAPKGNDPFSGVNLLLVSGRVTFAKYKQSFFLCLAIWVVTTLPSRYPTEIHYWLVRGDLTIYPHKTMRWRDSLGSMMLIGSLQQLPLVVSPSKFEAKVGCLALNQPPASQELSDGQWMMEVFIKRLELKRLGPMKGHEMMFFSILVVCVVVKCNIGWWWLIDISSSYLSSNTGKDATRARTCINVLQLSTTTVYLI